ncbi:FAD binding domain-containing protein [Hirsutella rhossiliensis]|uniref:FAD binding domain-containing protein n=1 Tax=Hirsutella rhossiliensis TaxID=111463 RepID=A0A9P8N8M3_9HYPO|nr:FAD binding domain-containing protein [Hirsutella rhossiliensis]KAH0966642.1 FAD binding domain-containing protein [Hirsutella rhossiliensis]
MSISRLVALLLANSAVALTATQHLTSQPRLDVEKTLVKHLAPRLSKDATIVLPSSPIAGPLLERATSPRISPGYAVIVEVATESDVQQTIKYANRHGMPFLAVCGGHGAPSTLNRLKNGIQINMRKMNNTRLHSDGQTAKVGGGTLQHELTAALFSHGKQTATVTGSCECISVAGPLLGGGHGMLQARHGLAADNLVSARVVLADGSAVDVSATEHPDLFWALRGAGHNFGIVTSLEIKTYDVRAPWTITTLSFTQDKLEAFFDTWNELLDAYEDPGMLALFGYILRDANLDSRHPVITLQMFSEGNDSALGDYTAAFRKLKPAAASTVNNIPWGDLHKMGGFGVDGPPCKNNRNLIGFPNSFARWDVAAMREGFELFSELTADPVFAASLVLLETYGNKGVRAVPERDNAVAPEERRYDILMSAEMLWAGDDAANVDKAARYGQRIREATRSPFSPPHSYLNYAMGAEGLEEVYGRGEVRLAKLRLLKEVYDPRNRFGFYMPIQQG